MSLFQTIHFRSSILNTNQTFMKNIQIQLFIISCRFFSIIALPFSLFLSISTFKPFPYGICPDVARHLDQCCVWSPQTPFFPIIFFSIYNLCKLFLTIHR